MRRFLCHIIVIMLLTSVYGCTDRKPVRIGFIGELTTRAAGLATSGRDGFLLAVETCNARGGINGRPVEALVRDTRMHKETALHAVNQLAAENVSAIIGPMTSQTAVAVVPAINRVKIPLVSPTASTNRLNGLDDYFFRVYYSNAQAAQLLARHLSEQEGIRRITAIYDLNNRAYTEDWVSYFQKALSPKDRAEVSTIPFDLRSETLYIDIANQAIESTPDAILILANAVDTAMICQQLAKREINVPLYATGWSYSDDLIQFGGSSVEGLAIIQSANLDDDTSRMKDFFAAYQNRYRSRPNFPALHAYDATRMVLAIMAEETDPQAIRQRLREQTHFQGVHGDLSLDRYGDLKNPELHLARIQQGQFVNFD